MFFSLAHANEAASGAAATSSGLSGLIPIVIIFAIFYFLLLRPQQKKISAHRDMVSALKRGDQVVTAGGVIGKVVKVDEQVAEVEIADSVVVKVSKNAITDLFNAATSEDKTADSKKVEARKKVVKKVKPKASAKSVQEK